MENLNLSMQTCLTATTSLAHLPLELEGEGTSLHFSETCSGGQELRNGAHFVATPVLVNHNSAFALLERDECGGQGDTLFNAPSTPDETVALRSPAGTSSAKKSAKPSPDGPSWMTNLNRKWSRDAAVAASYRIWDATSTFVRQKHQYEMPNAEGGPETGSSPATAVRVYWHRKSKDLLNWRPETNLVPPPYSLASIALEKCAELEVTTVSNTCVPLRQLIDVELAASSFHTDENNHQEPDAETIIEGDPSEVMPTSPLYGPTTAGPGVSLKKEIKQHEEQFKKLVQNRNKEVLEASREELKLYLQLSRAHKLTKINAEQQRSISSTELFPTPSLNGSSCARAQLPAHLQHLALERSPRPVNAKPPKAKTVFHFGKPLDRLIAGQNGKKASTCNNQAVVLKKELLFFPDTASETASCSTKDSSDNCVATTTDFQSSIQEPTPSWITREIAYGPKKESITSIVSLLPLIMPLPKSSGWINIRSNFRVDDDPILHFVPYFGEDDSLALASIDFSDYELVPNEIDKTPVSEAQEEVIRRVVLTHGYTPKVIETLAEVLKIEPNKIKHTLKDIQKREHQAVNETKKAQFKSDDTQALSLALTSFLGQTALPALQNPLINFRKQRESANSLLPGVAPVLVLSPQAPSRVRASNGCQIPAEPIEMRTEVNTKQVTNIEDLVESYRDLFCRRCFVYDCRRHGIQQPRPRVHRDPPIPRLYPLNAFKRKKRKLKQDKAADFHEISQDLEIMMKERQSSQDTVEALESENGLEAYISEAESTDAQNECTGSNKDNRIQPKPKCQSALLFSKMDCSEDAVHLKSYRNGTIPLNGRLSTGSQSDIEMTALSENTPNVNHPLSQTKITEEEKAQCQAIVDEWSSAEIALLEKCVIMLHESPSMTFSERSESYAQIIGSRTAVEVSACLQARQILEQGIEGKKNSFDDNFNLGKPKGSRHQRRRKRERPNGSTTAKKGRLREFIPCDHPGPCSSTVANAALAEGAPAAPAPCICAAQGTHCERFCACGATCRNQFGGCRCRKGACRSAACPCYAAGLECVPDLCNQCGAGVHPALLSRAIEKEMELEGFRICQNVNMQKGLKKKIAIGRSHIHGWGAYIKVHAEKNELIYEYTGELVSQDEADRRGKIYDQLNCSFLFNLNEDLVVDATHKGNKIKFANHSKAPNCYAKIVKVNSDHKIGIFAKKDLKPGEELSFDYAYTKELAPTWTNTNGELGR